MYAIRSYYVVAIAMSPGQRHITKPVCEITYGMRKENIQVSVLVLYSGSGIPESGMRTGSFVLSPVEVAQIEMHKLAVIHLGNIKDHVIRKTREILSQADIRITSYNVCYTKLLRCARCLLQRRFSSR